ncbi:DUF1648 domain-containing protein [Lactobacillus sp. XV13L]|nr:DUF1648 domain-containing protein [Lactobacillus sp. XV13L]
MNQNNFHKTFIVSNLLILLPAAVGLVLYNQLPQQMATHFGLNDAPNGFSNKAWVVLGLPAVILIIQGVMFWCFKHEARTKNLNFKVVGITFWFLPVMINVVNLSFYVIALGYQLRISVVLSICLGLFFIILGNYLPKIRPNQAVGIRLPWTLKNKLNWQKTHHLAGWTALCGGLILLLTAFLHLFWLVVAVVVGIILIPTVYSYALSKSGY